MTVHLNRTNARRRWSSVLFHISMVLTVTVLALGCAHTTLRGQHAVTGIPTPSQSLSRPEGTVQRLLQNATQRLQQDPFSDVENTLSQAKEAAGERADLLDEIAMLECAVHIERVEFSVAIEVLQKRIDAATNEHAFRAFSLHDRMIFLREATGDSLGAYLEAEAMRTVADWPSTPADLHDQVRLGYTWQRAHTLRNLAETLDGERRQQTIAYAEEARRSFAELARSRRQSLASVDVLTEQFAVLAHDLTTALAAASRLDMKALDPQDLYLTLLTYLAARDQPAIERLRAISLSQRDIDPFSSSYRYLTRRALSHAQ